MRTADRMERALVEYRRQYGEKPRRFLVSRAVMEDIDVELRMSAHWIDPMAPRRSFVAYRGVPVAVDDGLTGDAITAEATE